MLIPSIDIRGGRAVQLCRGETLVIDAGDPRPLARRFAPLGEVAVIDLDAALGTGDNRELIEELLPLARCRVGGGIRDADAARRWLDAGAARVILGTAARPDVLAGLPRERVIAALDARNGEVVVEGWRTGTGRGIIERIGELSGLVSGLLVTFVEIEGTMQGFEAARAAELVPHAERAGARLTIAGGVTTAAEIGELDRLGCDAQVGMAIYSGRLGLAEAWSAPLTSDRPDKLWPTVVADTEGVALGLAYSNIESLHAALAERRAVFWSRRRGLWRKGDQSGDVFDLLRVDADCDRDCIRFTVRPVRGRSGFCHIGEPTCWGGHAGLAGLEARVHRALLSSDAASYTARLARDPALLRAKLVEEACELVDATDPAHIAAEAADVLYFLTARLAAAGVTLGDAARELDRRARRVSRRPGLAKPPCPSGERSTDPGVAP